MRGQSAAQCSTGFLPQAQNATFCLMPPLRDPQNLKSRTVIWETGCDCLCAQAGRWWTDANECESLGGWMALTAVFLCVLLTECTYRLFLRILPSSIDRWHPVHGADVECAIVAVLCCTLSFVPFV